MSPSEVGVLFKPPTPSGVARAEAKLYHALATILLWVGFAPSPTSSTSHGLRKHLPSPIFPPLS